MMQQSASEWHGFDPEIGAPHDRDVLEDRTVVRIETDGNGNTVEVPVGKDDGRSFGLPADLPGQMRRRFDRLSALKENGELASPEVQRAVLRELRSEGPMTKDELADRTRTWRYQVADALGKLSRKGICECFPHPDAGGRKYLWKMAGT